MKQILLAIHVIILNLFSVYGVWVNKYVPENEGSERTNREIWLKELSCDPSTYDMSKSNNFWIVIGLIIKHVCHFSVFHLVPDISDHDKFK